MQEETKPVSFKNNYIFLTLFMFLFIGLSVSFFPEKHFGYWLIFNSSVAILAACVNYIIWIFQRHDRKRYFSLHNFVMMVVLIYYAMSPAFVSLYPSTYFWSLLAITVGIAILLFMNRVSVARAFVNPGGWFMIILIIFFVVLVCLVLMSPSRNYEGSMPAARALLYLIGLGLMSISPVLLTSREKAKELENMPVE